MTKLPTDISGRDLIRVLEKIGFVVKRQRGSHIILRRDSPFARIVVPDHKILRLGTLRAILHEAGLSADELINLL
jgi:predicted RNA binding protein YcfA (HicA-like mRNA interferase family)